MLFRSDAIICSVVPNIMHSLQNGLIKYFNIRPIIVPKQTTNTACLYSYQMNVDFKTDIGNKAGIVLSARNKDNYVLFDVDMDNRTLMIYEYCDNAWDGSTKEGHIPTVTILGSKVGYIISKDAVSEGLEHD